MIDFIVAKYVIMNTVVMDKLIFILKFNKEITETEDICFARYDVLKTGELFINPYKKISKRKESEIYKYIYRHLGEFEMTYSQYVLSNHIKIILKFPLDLKRLHFSKMSWEYLINNNYQSNRQTIVELRKGLTKLGIRV